MAKITGIGGVFFKAKGDAKALTEWYQTHLGLVLEDFGAAVLKWPLDTAGDGGATVWVIADKESQWFQPSEEPYMINYRVDNLDEMIEELTSKGIAIQQGPETHENGKFAWIMDPEGRKIELWQPMLMPEKATE